MKLADFLRALQGSLANPPRAIEEDRWAKELSYRTHVMKGDAIRNEVGRSPNSVLDTTLSVLGYHRYRRGESNERIYDGEWNGIDMMAVTCPGNWDKDVWAGRYRYDLQLEVENDVQEFTFHMRGLIDHRSVLNVCIFYAPHDSPLDEIEVGTGKGKAALRPLRDWDPPWTPSPWAVPAATAPCITAVFLGADKPVFIGARHYDPLHDVPEDILPGDLATD